MTRGLLVVGVDPGLATGVALLQVRERVELVTVAEVHAGRVRALLNHWDNRYRRVRDEYDVLVGMERYTITSQTAKKTPQHHALHVIGVVGGWASELGAEVVLQAPGDAKKLVKNRLLRRVGWWSQISAERATDHGADAVRQALRVVALRRASVFGDLISSGRMVAG